MPDFLMHLWAGPPATIAVPCPAPPPDGVPDPGGFLNPTSVSAAYSVLGLISLLTVVGLVLLCYLATKTSLGPRFIRRWYLFLGGSAVLGLLLPLLVLRLWETRVFPGSCETNPTPFAHPIPWDLIILRGVAGFVWAPLVFVLFSLLLTQLVGVLPQAGGLFHNRGCPYPRWRP